MFFQIFCALLSLWLTTSSLFCDETDVYPPPFEKIYVSPNEILSTYEGTYYISPYGEYRPIRTIRRDSEGRTYVILITQVCPICGRLCAEKTCSEGYDCPFFELEVRRNYWSDH